MVKFLNTLFFWVGSIILCLGMCCEDTGFMTALIFSGISILYIILHGKPEEYIKELTGAAWFEKKFGIDLMSEE